jgi:hypothetical protein
MMGQNPLVIIRKTKDLQDREKMDYTLSPF